MKYHQLTEAQRYQIQRLIKLKKGMTEVSRLVGIHRSTLYREIERNSLVYYGESKPNYDAISAHGISNARRTESCETRYKVQGLVKEYVIEKLKKRWSPEQISGRAAVEGLFKAHASSIYRFIENDRTRIASENLYKNLRRFKLKRYRRKRRIRKCYSRKGAPKKNIRERSIAADLRKDIGHFERDLMEGKRGTRAVLVIVDRKSRLLKLRFVKKCGDQVQAETAKILNSEQIKKKAKSMTNDNGPEFIRAISAKAEDQLGVPVYFCDPCSPWQRGTVENSIGLLREYLPKGLNLTTISSQKLTSIEKQINSRPRKVLNFNTPSENFFSRISKKRIHQQ